MLDSLTAGGVCEVDVTAGFDGEEREGASNEEIECHLEETVVAVAVAVVVVTVEGLARLLMRAFGAPSVTTTSSSRRLGVSSTRATGCSGR